MQPLKAPPRSGIAPSAHTPYTARARRNPRTSAPLKLICGLGGPLLCPLLGGPLLGGSWLAVDVLDGGCSTGAPASAPRLASSRIHVAHTTATAATSAAPARVARGTWQGVRRAAFWTVHVHACKGGAGPCHRAHTCRRMCTWPSVRACVRGQAAGGRLRGKGVHGSAQPTGRPTPWHARTRAHQCCH